MTKKLKLLLLLTGFFALVLACSKSDNGGSSCTNVPVENDADSIQYYISQHNLTNVLKDESSGLYYQVIQPGTGAYPTLNSDIYIKYTGYFIHGNIFDQNQDAASTGWRLSTLIPGWQVGIPKINRGGQIRLFVPSALGYGCRGSGSVIPANAVLIFDVELVDFK